MSDPARVRVTGPLGVFGEGFAAELVRQGYRPNATASQLQLMAHLSRSGPGRGVAYPAGDGKSGSPGMGVGGFGADHR
jgi:hypothetical protein